MCVISVFGLIGSRHDMIQSLKRMGREMKRGGDRRGVSARELQSGGHGIESSGNI